MSWGAPVTTRDPEAVPLFCGGDDRESLLERVSGNGILLLFFPEEMRGDFEIVMSAVFRA